MSFESLGLNETLLRNVARSGYTQATAIQSKAIPAIIGGADLLGAAQTGSGKTAAFVLPILNQLMTGEVRKGRRAPRVLVLAPTRELAAQIESNVRTYAADLPLRSMAIFGGVSPNPQAEALRRGVDLVIATPGRLLDHASTGVIDLSHIETLVLDEADRMLDMGFIRDIRRVLKLLPPKRQNLMFSATFNKDIRQLANSLLTKPIEIDVAPRNSAAESVHQEILHVRKTHKRAVLSWIIGDGNWRQVLVFTRTKHGANRLTKQLETDGLSAAAIHGNKSQGARTKALEGFKAGTIRVLVATDVAARGIDIDQLPHVVNYELPNVAEDYVHRIGRTGRAGESGTALSLVDREEREHLRGIEKLISRKLPEANIDWSKSPIDFNAPAPAEPEDTRPERKKAGPGQPKRGSRPPRRRSGGGGGGGNGRGRDKARGGR